MNVTSIKKSFAKFCGFVLAVCVALTAGAAPKAVSAQSALTAETYFVRGASVRLKLSGESEERTGIRFSVVMEKSAFTSLCDENGNLKADVSTGTLLLPGSLIGAGEELTVATADAADTDTTELWHEISFDADKDGTPETYMETLVSLWNIPAAYYSAEITARGYVTTGESTVYTAPLARSMNYVAKAAVDDDDSLRGELHDFLPVYTVSFRDREGQSAHLADVKAVYGDTIAEPESAEFNFDGWYKDAACTEAWNFATDVVAEDITLYTKECVDANVTFTVSFQDKDGNGVNLEDVTVKSGGKLTEPVSDTHGFYGWYKDAACTQLWDFAVDTVKGETVLYTPRCVDKTQAVFEYDFSAAGADAANVVAIDSAIQKWEYNQASAAIIVDTLSADVGANASRFCLYFNDPVPRENIGTLSVKLRYKLQCNFHNAMLILSPKGADTLELGGNADGLPSNSWEVALAESTKNLSFGSKAEHFKTPSQKTADMVYGICFDVRGGNNALGRYMIHSISYTFPAA